MTASVNHCNAKKVGALLVTVCTERRKENKKYKRSGAKDFCEMMRCRTKTRRQRTRGVEERTSAK